MEPIRMLIADDHPYFRKGVRTLVSPVPETDIVGEAATRADAIALAARLQPDVVLMELQMPDVNGIEATPTRHPKRQLSAAMGHRGQSPCEPSGRHQPRPPP